ncbi:hypothetical protein [Levilactobacillus yonginensis]|uniref:hypothetical protein n=1 Tax=Levilactobacillus yonginensis TaxID=1054041 RepID=UPI00345D3468
MQLLGVGAWQKWFKVVVACFMLIVSLGLPVGNGYAIAKGRQHSYETGLTKTDKRALKIATLNRKGLSIAWPAVLQHKIKLLKKLKKHLTAEKGSVYSKPQVKSLNHRLNQLTQKYQRRLKKLRAQGRPANVEYYTFWHSDGSVAFTKDKIKQVGRRTIIVQGIQEYNGIFHYYGGHGAGFRV